MRPIDTIRGRIDSDLIKYHSSNLCIIDDDKDVFNLEGIGVCALVRLFKEYERGGPKPTSEEYFPVLIINRPYGWIESNVSKKCYVITISSVEDRVASLSTGFLVSQTALSDIEDFRSRRLKEKEVGNDVDNSEDLISRKEDNIVTNF